MSDGGLFGLLAAAVAGVCSAVLSSAAVSADERPNVLMIVVDDMNDWVGCLQGHPDVQTPHIDRLAARGVLFANAHAAAPVCNPSRVAALTGRRPSSTGIYGNDAVWHTVLGDVPSIPAVFRGAGYHTLGGGKVHHHTPGFNRRTDWDGYFDQVFDSHYQQQLSRGELQGKFSWPSGFPLNGLPEVRSLQKPPQNPVEFDWGPFDVVDEELGDGQMVEWAVKFLQSPREPFFLAAGIYRPHLPFYAPRKYFEMYDRDRLSLPVCPADDLRDLPAAGVRMARDRGGDYELVQQAGRQRELVQAYLASISYADALVGRLLQALDATDAGRRTLIVFWSDHGWHLGEKQHLHKFTLWERSTRVPLIVAGAGVPGQGLRCPAPVSLVDLLPTLCELSGPGLAAVPNGIDGQSFAAQVREPAMPRERPAVTTHGVGNHAVRSARWRYIRYADGGAELYDHAVDPHEWANLADRPEFATVISEHARWLPQTNAAPLRVKKQKGQE